MRAVWLQVPEWVLEQRRRTGEDKHDELWDGVLHMSPMGSSIHGLVITNLLIALDPIARRRSLKALTSEFNMIDREDNFRVPDGTIVRAEEHLVGNGLVGAELVIEVLSPHDESREKQPFYAGRGIRESWIIDPITRAHEVYELVRGDYVRVPSRFGVTTSPAFGIELSIIDGPLLRIVDGDYVASV